MTHEKMTNNRVRQRRSFMGLTQAELAERAGISRTAVTAIEGDHLLPSVATALALAETLETTVEQLFGKAESAAQSDEWAWKPRSMKSSFWRAEVGGKHLLYPADSVPMYSLPADRSSSGAGESESRTANETLVIACCDPAAGILASQFAASTGMRLVVLSRSSRDSIAMLRSGLVHLAGLHFSTRDEPDRNTETIRSELGANFQTVRLARWQEGIVVRPATRIHSVRDAVKSKLNWVGREAGSGARRCLDQLLGDRPSPRRVARDHRGVVEAVKSGWADAGVCVQLVGEEAGLNFLPLQEEAFDVCYANAMSDDRRIKAFLKVVRSAAYRKQIGDLPGYDSSETGSVRTE